MILIFILIGEIQVKISKILLFNTILIVLSLSIITAIHAQSTEGGDIGGFDIEKGYEEASGEGDTALAGDAGTTVLPRRQSENYAIVLLRVVGYLVVIVLIIFAAAWGVRKIGISGVSKVGGGNNMDVIETIYLGQNRGAALVRVADTVYLLGHTPENIVLIEKIEGDKAVELIASTQGSGTITTFKDAFNNFMGRMKRS